MTIRSMTAFGNARTEGPEGQVSLEVRSVNSRYLDVTFRLPDDLRFAEGALREKLSQHLTRGKVEVRLSYARTRAETATALDDAWLKSVATQLAQARDVLPDTPSPSLAELVKGSGNGDTNGFDPQAWTHLSVQALDDALADMQANREREGQRLAQMMLECAASIDEVVVDVEAAMPQLLSEHKAKLANRLREALEAANPGGFAQISGEELSARIAQETSLFSLRVDVAEELQRLKSHLAELQHILTTGDAKAGKTAKGAAGSVGKRLDFLFQEMNREANTLGSKAAGLEVTRAAIDLKLLIEQMREQAQNIE